MNSPAYSARSAEGLPYANAVELFADRVARQPNRAALRHKQDGAWHTLSWRELDDRVRDFAAGLVAWGSIERGERVAILAPNCVGWIVADIAVARLGAVSVPVEPHTRGSELASLVEACRCSIAVVGTAVELRRIQAIVGNGRADLLRKVVVLELDSRRERAPDKPTPDVISWRDLAEVGHRHRADVDPVLTARTGELRGDDLFTIVHTPKTSGSESKGVALSHRNIVYETWALRNVIAVDRSDEQLLLLPLCHAFGRHLVWAAFASGAVTSVMDPGATVLDNLRDVAPTFLGAAPVVYEAIRRRILRDVEDGGRMRAKSFAWCLDVGKQVSEHRQRGEIIPSLLGLKQAAADRLAFAEIRRGFGGRLRFLVSGAAPARPEVLEFFHAAGLLILEGYGLTETSGAVSVNRPDRYRFGTVGPVLPGCEVRIADDGEVLVRGDNVMHGYVGAAAKEPSVVDERGWLHTGDLGAVEHGFLRIVGRKCEIIELLGGRRVHPEPIEQALGEHTDISHALVCGGGRPQLTALLTLDRAAARAFARRNGLDELPFAELVEHPRLRARISAWIDRVNRTLPAHERLLRFTILPRDLGAATGELTPTLRPRRRVVYQRWADTISAMYADPGQSPGSKPFVPPSDSKENTGS